MRGEEAVDVTVDVTAEEGGESKGGSKLSALHAAQ